MCGRSNVQLLSFKVKSRAFLHNQIRLMVGTLMHVGYGKLAPNDIAALLSKRSRALLPQQSLAPAQGLCLTAVRYPPLDQLPELSHERDGTHGAVGDSTDHKGAVS